MNGKGVSGGPDRRQLLTQILPAGAFACLFCRRAFAVATEEAGEQASALKTRSQEPCGMSYEELFKFAYADGMIPVMKGMEAEIGKEKFLAMLERASSAAAEEGVRRELKKNPKNDFATFAAEFRKTNRLFDHTLTYRIVEETPNSIAMRSTECMWANTFCDAGAADIGYVAMCRPDIAAARAFNPKLKLTLTKTLMQRHDCCDHRWVMES